MCFFSFLSHLFKIFDFFSKLIPQVSHSFCWADIFSMLEHIFINNKNLINKKQYKYKLPIEGEV